MGPGISISNEFPGDADASVPGATFWESLKKLKVCNFKCKFSFLTTTTTTTKHWYEHIFSLYCMLSFKMHISCRIRWAFLFLQFPRTSVVPVLTTHLHHVINTQPTMWKFFVFTLISHPYTNEKSFINHTSEIEALNSDTILKEST